MWEAAGAMTLRDRARARVFEIWGEHVVEPLPADVVRGMQAVIAARRAQLP
jgi:trimethylamine:corrinoid methyltransferase-like protein